MLFCDICTPSTSSMVKEENGFLGIWAVPNSMEVNYPTAKGAVQLCNHTSNNLLVSFQMQTFTCSH